MVRPVTDDDIGIKVLRDLPAGATTAIDIVAIHGIGAHPDDTWCRNVGSRDHPQWVSWLDADDMLPAVAPRARIMRYGYQSQWFGKSAMRQNTTTVAERLLRALRRKRENAPSRPLLFIAHCFGGLVVLKALVKAKRDEEGKWNDIFALTTGLVFFGTPFRGAPKMSQVEMLAAARREYQDDEVEMRILEILEPENAFLQEVVDDFCRARSLSNKAHVACFYETKLSNLGRIVGKTDRIGLVVTESSACLDLSDATSKYSLSRTHFDMNKFGKPSEEDFETVSEVIKDMIEASPGLLSARSQCSRHDSTNHNYDVAFSLRGMPVVNKFVARGAEMQALENFLISDASLTINRRKVIVVHGMGGSGKTQLAVAFAREHCCSFSGIFWLDGSSLTSLKQSFVSLSKMLPLETVHDFQEDTDGAVHECLRWLSLASNPRWLMIIDNIDRDHNDTNDAQAYNVKEYLPDADHGSILITSRLDALQRLGEGVKIGTVGAEQARDILENNAGRKISDADIVLDLLDGLPLALTQAGSFMRETNMSTLEYATYYREGKPLFEKQSRFPPEEYGDRSVLTTWCMSYEQVQRQSKEAACLLKLWGLLDCRELQYEILSAEPDTKTEELPGELDKIARSELEFREATMLLHRYSLVEPIEGGHGYSMHPVLHKWCGLLTENGDRLPLLDVATKLLTAGGPTGVDWGPWDWRKPRLSHAMSLSAWIEKEAARYQPRELYKKVTPEALQTLGCFLFQWSLSQAEMMCKLSFEGFAVTRGLGDPETIYMLEIVQLIMTGPGQPRGDAEADKMLELALDSSKDTSLPHLLGRCRSCRSLARFYKNQGRLDQAEKLLSYVLIDIGKLVGVHHSATLEMVKGLGNVYLDQGRLDEAEQMFTFVRKGLQKFANYDQRIDTHHNTWDFAELRASQGHKIESRELFRKAASNIENTFGSTSPLGKKYRAWIETRETKWAREDSLNQEYSGGEEEYTSVGKAILDDEDIPSEDKDGVTEKQIFFLQQSFLHANSQHRQVESVWRRGLQKLGWRRRGTAPEP